MLVENREEYQRRARKTHIKMLGVVFLLLVTILILAHNIWDNRTVPTNPVVVKHFYSEPVGDTTIWIEREKDQ